MILKSMCGWMKGERNEDLFRWGVGMSGWALEAEVLDCHPDVTTDQLYDLGPVTLSSSFLIKTQE